jgi:hypothetical protein
VTASYWGLIAFTIAGAVAIARDLIALRRQQTRRDRLQSLVKCVGQGGRITDTGPDGRIEVEIGQVRDSPLDGER